MKPATWILLLIIAVAGYGIFQALSLSKDHEYFRVEVETKLGHMTRTTDDAIMAEIARIATVYGIDPTSLQTEIRRSETPGAPHVPGMAGSFLPGQFTRTTEARVRYTRPILFYDHEYQFTVLVRKTTTPHPQEKSMQEAFKELIPKTPTP